MQKNRKICCRITPGRIVGTVLLAASAVNLIIVGAAFEVSFPKAVPAITATPSAFSVTTIPPPTATASYTPTFTAEPTDTPIPTWTTTSTATPTETATSTPTFTPSPVPTQCIPRYDWPVYRIQRGDTLSSLTQTTGSSVQELMLANCLIDSRIFAGQLLHVPRLPLVPATAVPLMPSDTSPLKNSAAVFKPNSMTCDGPGYVALSAAIYDLEGVTAAFVQLYTGKGEVITTLEMTPDGDIYFGSDSLPGTFTVNDVGYYIFSAVDQLEGVTKSQPYNDRSANCIPLPTDIPPVSPG